MLRFVSTPLRLVDQTFRVLLTTFAFTFFYCGGSVLSWLRLPIGWLGGGARIERIRRCQRIVQNGFVFFHDFMRIGRLVGFDPRKVGLRLPPGPCVLVANHPTLVDVTAIIATVGNLSCVVKRILFFSPTLGPLLRFCWHINSGAGDATAGAAVMVESLQRLRSGMTVLIFPEGTRSPEGGLRAFNRGAFEIASRADVPVVPVFLSCHPAMLSKEAPWYRAPAIPAQYHMIQLPTLDPKRWNGDSRAMAADVQALYQLCLEGKAPAARGPREPKPRVELAKAVGA